MNNSSSRSWISTAIQIIEADFSRSSDTHMLRVLLPAAPGVALYLKDGRPISW
jgi:cysteine synthase A